MTKTDTLALVDALTAADQDFEWYPTTDRMIAAVVRDLSKSDDPPDSFMDIGAGDGRVLLALAAGNDSAKLYSIEKSAILQQRQPDRIIPVGCDFVEQNLMSLPVDVLFCNPPYSEFEAWVYRIISTAYARQLYLVIPQRWESSALIKEALTARDAEATIIHRDDFLDADRQARAVVHIVRVRFEEPGNRHRYSSRSSTPAQDPFNLWFDQNIDTFDREAEINDSELESTRLARIRGLDTIPEMVEAFHEEHARMEDNYRAIFKLDGAVLKELSVSKETLREGLKKRIAGLKHTYWQGLFERLDAITSRLTTATKKRFLERLTGQTAIAFTTDNAYAVVLWAIKAANSYFDVQTVDFFRTLATKDGVENYVSNTRTWVKSHWRYNSETDAFTHFKLDYRIVLPHFRAINNDPNGFGQWEHPNGLHTSAHEIVEDAVAVCSNLGFKVADTPSRRRTWVRGQWQDFRDAEGETLFQVKAFQNGNLQWRFRPEVIKALNIEAGRLLGWLRTPEEAAAETGYSPEDVTKYFNKSHRLGAAAVRLLSAGA